MSRLVPAFASALIALALPGMSLAADYGDPLRGAYPTECCTEEFGYASPLEFELGLRYGYTWGAQSLTAAGSTYSGNDNTHIIEGQFRIDDNSTNSYLRGTAGISFLINNTYQTPTATGLTTQNGQVTYAIADFGMMPLDLDVVKAGAFIGYQYLHDNPSMGRANFTTAAGGGDSEPNNFDIHAVRIGVVGRAEFGDFEINAQAALIPYAQVDGSFGAYAVSNFSSGGVTYTQGSAATINGSLWGGAGEIMLGYSPHPNIKLKAGARAYYLTGSPTIEFTARQVGNPSNAQNYIATNTNFSMLRYGPLAEVSVAF